MKRMTDRRTILLAAGTTAAAAMAGAVAAQSSDIRGTIAYEDGTPIPAGRIRFSFDGIDSTSTSTDRSAAPADLDSSGKATMVDFVIPQPALAARATTPVEVVVTLERDDGWLLARGSAPLTPGAPVTITLYKAMY